MNKNLNTLVRQIEQLDSREDINTVIHAIRRAQQNCSFAARQQFSPGDRVYWHNKYGQNTTGTVDRILPKNIMVKSDQGVTWRVSPQLLKLL